MGCRMAENSRMSKLSEKDDECIFSWKLFTAWDYMIGNAETAHNRLASIVMGFKEALLEEAEKKRESRNWRIIGCRVLVNTFVLGLLSFSAFAVIMVVKRSTEPEANSTVWRKNEITVVMSLITQFFPMLFEVLGFFEQYHPRTQLRFQLARIMVLNLLNLYSLIFALFDKIEDMTTELQEFKNLTQFSEPTALALTTSLPIKTTALQSYFVPTNCHQECIDNNDKNTIKVADMIAALAINITTVSYSKIAQLVTENYNDSTETTNSFIENLTYFNDNYSTTTTYRDVSENFTELFDNNFNLTVNNDTNINYTDFRDNFIDYLTFILHSFDSSIVNKIGTNFTADETQNLTDVNATDAAFFTQEYFKTTFIPIINNITDSDLDERFDSNLTTIYQEILTTMSTLLPNISSSKNCTEVCNFTYPTLAPVAETTLNYSAKARLRSLCWETMFGQELIKLTVMDLIMTVLSTLAIDFFRGLFVRFMNRCWCWDLEKRFPQYGDFKVAENILHLVNNQGMVWMGMFFSPGLVVMNVAKLYMMMYLRTWAVLTCNVPHEIIFRASRSNNFYYALLLMMLFLCVLPVGYAVVWVQPSWHCGPFSAYKRIFHIFTKTITDAVPPRNQRVLEYIASPGIVIPLLVLLILYIYYLISLTGALREANNDLKFQLRRERTEERRKMFQIADRRRRGGSGGSGDTPFNKWKKLLGSLPSDKSFDETPKQESEDLPPPIKEEKPENKNKDFFAKFIKKALGKSSTSDEDQNAEDGTDTEQHESLPEDGNGFKEVKPQVHRPLKPSISSGSYDFQSLASRALSLKKNQQRKLDHSPTDSSDNMDARHVQIQDVKPLKYSNILNRKDTFDLKKNAFMRKTNYSAASTSKDTRQDSVSSIWSDNIPVIRISKTESSENILSEASEISSSVRQSGIEGGASADCSSEVSPQIPKKEKRQTEDNAYKTDEVPKFKPKVKCALQKQTAEIDEDTICYFSKDLERKVVEEDVIKTVADEDLPLEARSEIAKFDELSDVSSSEGTEMKDSSQDTILNLPYAVSDKEEDKGAKLETTSVDTQKSSNNGSIQTESSSGYNDDNLS